MVFLDGMRIVPIVSDSMGVRSLSVFIEFKESPPLCIDGGVRIAPKRFGLPPTRLEERTLRRYTKLMEDCIRASGFVVISHYHYDHYMPDSDAYAEKRIFVKDPEEKINHSQRTRGELFRKINEKKAELFVADRKEFRFDDFTLSFSPPVPHGEDDTSLGFVLMTYVRDEETGETLLHTSDVQGPISVRTADKIMEYEPDLLIMDGAPTYLAEWERPEIMTRVRKNLQRIIEVVRGRIIYDHHNMRDDEWNLHLNGLKVDKLTTYAEYHRTSPLLLEAMRKDIWRMEHRRETHGKN